MTRNLRQSGSYSLLPLRHRGGMVISECCVPIHVHTIDRTLRLPRVVWKPDRTFARSFVCGKCRRNDLGIPRLTGEIKSAVQVFGKGGVPNERPAATTMTNSERKLDELNFYL